MSSDLPNAPPSEWNFRNAAKMVELISARVVLVEGNTGEDCKQCMKLGAMEVLSKVSEPSFLILGLT
jgi:hypothetical protein